MALKKDKGTNNDLQDNTQKKIEYQDPLKTGVLRKGKQFLLQYLHSSV
jgi:hypothetical protein